MTSNASIDAGIDRIFDDTQSYETVASYAALQFLEDFIGAGHTAGIPAAGSPIAGYPWVAKLVKTAGSPTAALVANAAGGQVAIALDATSEKQEATLTWNDNLSLDATKKLNFEARIKLGVPPSATGVQAVFGLAQSWIDGPDNNTRLIQFGCKANNGLTLRMIDSGALVSQAAAYLYAPATQVALDTSFHVFRIDISDPADIGFYMDGSRLNAKGSFAFTSIGANAILQPYFSVYKPAGTGLATLTVDKADVWSQRA